MFNSFGSFLGFLGGLALTLGLLLSPHLVPGGYGFRAGYAWPAWLQVEAFAAGLALVNQLV